MSSQYLDDDRISNDELKTMQKSYPINAISSFPDDPSTIANIIDEFNFEHQVIISLSNTNLIVERIHY